MHIHVNGEIQSVENALTITGLLEHLCLPADQVAVEVNLSIIDRNEFSVHQLRDGDRVEIMSFIGGGSSGP